MRTNVFGIDLQKKMAELLDYSLSQQTKDLCYLHKPKIHVFENICYNKVEGKVPVTTQQTTLTYNIMPPKKRIPKRESTELLQDIKLNSPDAKELLANLRRTCLADEDIERLWNPQMIQLVQNAELQKNYEQRKKEMKENGRKGKEIEDKIVFVAETWAGIQKICKFGIRCLENKRQVLGDTKHGVHLNRHFDVMLRFMAFSNSARVRYVIIFKALFGRTKAVTAKLDDDQNSIEPIPNYDSHISNRKPDIQMDMFEVLSHNYVYLYEYDEETSYPVQFPRNVLPYAVIQMSRTEVSIERPLKWGTSRKKAIKKNTSTFDTTQRKTWNSRAAAITAGIPVESMKENTIPPVDTSSGMTFKTEDTEMAYNNDQNTPHIKPCKIELFRSDMDIDERIKVPPNVEFDTVSGTRLIATERGFVKDIDHSGETVETPEIGDTIYVTIFENSADMGNGTIEPLNLTTNGHIKQEPDDPEFSGSVNNIADTDLRPLNIKKEISDKGYDKAARQHNICDSNSQNSSSSSSGSAKDIGSTKQEILKRLEQVEREIHWKKQKIDDLHKQSIIICSNNENVSDTSEIEPSNDIVKEEINLEPKSNYDTTEMCSMQNKQLRNLSLSIDTREQINRESEEGDSTPTLDEPVDRLWTEIDVTGKTPVYSSGSSGSEKTHSSLMKSSDTSCERKNIFDAYSSENSFLTNGFACTSSSVSTNSSLQENTEIPDISTKETNHLDEKVVKLEPSLGSEVTQQSTKSRNRESLKHFVLDDKSSFERLIEANMATSPIPEIKQELGLQPHQPKHSPIDVYKNEKKCSPFLAKYLEKKYSISGLDNQKRVNEIPDQTDDFSSAVTRTEGNTPSDLPFPTNHSNDQTSEMPLLTPITTQADDQNGFSFSAAVANIKKIMETGEITPTPSTKTAVQTNPPNPRDPRFYKASDESKPDFLNSDMQNTNMDKPKETALESSISSSDSKIQIPPSGPKPKWLPGVLIKNSDTSDNTPEKVSSQDKDIVTDDNNESPNDNSCALESEDSKSELPQDMKQEMKLTLQKLDAAIKVIQSRYTSDEESSPVKSRKSLESDDNKNDVESNSSSDDGSGNETATTDIFQNEQSVCNSGTGNRKETYKDNNSVVGTSDIERTNRVLNDVFRSDLIHSVTSEQQNSSSLTSIQQIQTVATTNIEIKTTQYTETVDTTYLDGYDASAYSAVVEQEAVGHRIPVKLSGMAMRRPYSKWAETYRLKALERQRRILKNRIFRRYGFDRLKRNREMEKKWRPEGKRQILQRKCSRKRSRSRSLSPEKRCSRSKSHGTKSRSRSKSNSKHSPKKGSDSHFDVGSSRRRSRTESSSNKRHRSKSKSDRCSSPKRSKLSPIRDMNYLSFKERGVIMFKIKHGVRLNYVERQKYTRNRHKFIITSRVMLAKSLKCDGTTNYKSYFGKKPNNTFRIKSKYGDKSGSDGKSNSKPIFSKYSPNSFSSREYKDTSSNRSRERRHSENSDQQKFQSVSTFRTFSSSNVSRDFKNTSEFKSGYREFNQGNSSRLHDFRERGDGFNGKYSKDFNDSGRNERRYSVDESRSSEAGSFSRDRYDRTSRSSQGDKSPENAERNTEKTLSKAMTSLLTKIIQGDSGESVDNSAEGQMANMLYQLMKQKVQTETSSALSRTSSNAYSSAGKSYDSSAERSYDNSARKPYDRRDEPRTDIQRTLIDYQLSRQKEYDAYRSVEGDSDIASRSHERDNRTDNRRNYSSNRRNFSENNYHYQDKRTSRDRESNERPSSKFYQNNAEHSSSNSRSYHPRSTPQSTFHSNGGRGFPSNRRFQQRGSSKFQNHSERTPYQRRDFNKDRNNFRHGSASSSSSSASRHESYNRSSRNFKT